MKRTFGILWHGMSPPIDQTNLTCSGCGDKYITHARKEDWLHCECWTGPAPLQSRQAAHTYYSGSTCGRCTVDNLYRTQDIFEDFVRLASVTKALTS